MPTKVAPAASRAGRQKATTKQNRPSGFRVVPLPLATYAKETSVLFAAAVLASYLPEEPGRKNSSLLSALVYTLRNQTAWTNQFNVFVLDDRLLINGDITVARYPSSYFGLGNDTRKGDEERYTPFVANGFVNPLWRVAPDLYLGPSFEARHMALERYRVGGALALTPPPGTTGTTNVGAGIAAIYDSRDNTVSPYRGQRVEYFSRYYVQARGQTGDFSAHRLDARSYHDLGAHHVVSLRFLADVQTDTPPFNLRPSLGGRFRNRGIFAGRYAERNALTVQADYRTPPLLWRIGAGAFASLGQVANDVGDYRINAFHPAGGVGLRALLSEDARINFRVDLGVSEDDWGVYVNLGEPF